MKDYEYLPGYKTSAATPWLQHLADKYNERISDLVAAKKAGNFTDFGIQRILAKAHALGLTWKTVIAIDTDLNGYNQRTRQPWKQRLYAE